LSEPGQLVDAISRMTLEPGTATTTETHLRRERERERETECRPAAGERASESREE
jgi:hypothetical protein